jgi:hypothetical protein
LYAVPIGFDGEVERFRAGFLQVRRAAARDRQPLPMNRPATAREAVAALVSSWFTAFPSAKPSGRG